MSRKKSLSAVDRHMDKQGKIAFMDGEEYLLWESGVGRAIRANAPQLTLQEPKDLVKLPITVALTKHSSRRGDAMLEYRLGLNANSVKITGTAMVSFTLPHQDEGDALLCQVELAFRELVRSNVTAEFSFDLQCRAPEKVVIPQRDGILQTVAFPAGCCFKLGQAANDGSPLGMPVVGYVWDDLQLAVSADPYCGCAINGTTGNDGIQISVATNYPGSVVPVQSERRTFVLEFHRKGADGTLRSFYRTIPEIEPDAPWTQAIHLVYFDYLSQGGEGWFKDLKVLAERIPSQNRGHVAVCLHGWYDYFQQYGYDHPHRVLLKEWTAFPSTYKVPMSLAEMHRRLKFAKDLGFRVLLYFADGTNSDSGAPNFRKEYLLKDKNGETFSGFKGPDSVGQPLMMDPSVPGLREWYRGYLRALLDEYARVVDGFVWDETFYIPADFISYSQAEPAHADRAMMSLVSELTQMAQSYHQQNPDLVFLASDCGQTSYALVANGTFQDSTMEEEAWGPSMFANYRNCLWSCNWFPLRYAERNKIAAEKYGLPQGVSNGWQDNCGPSQMPPELLEAVLRRFTKNVESSRQRLRYLIS